MNSLHSAVALALLCWAPIAARAQSLPEPLLELARSIAPSAGTADCTEHVPTAQDARSRTCRYTLSATTGADTIVVSFFTADSVMLQLDHRLTDAAAMTRFVQHVDAFAQQYDMTRRNCGAGETPAGATRGHLWYTDRILVSLTELARPETPPRALLVAISPPGTYPTDQLCPGRDRDTR